MPELPEVETVVRALRQPLIGATILEMHCSWPKQLVTPAEAEFRARIHGCRVESINRRAKYLLFALTEGETLVVHLKMTGHLAVVPAGTAPDKHVHTYFELADGRQLRFRDMRKFGRLYLVKDPAEILNHLGPEPLEPAFTPTVAADRLSGSRRAIKTLLLDQSRIAGIGNIYADEALFAAGIHPERLANSLSQPEIRALHGAIQKVLQLGIDREGASISNYVHPDGTKGDMQNAVAVFRRTGFPCYDCDTAIERIVLGGRSTHFCPHCQH
jgi:formamidopyrimidine-DNA glycosylase